MLPQLCAAASAALRGAAASGAAADDGAAAASPATGARFCAAQPTQLGMAAHALPGCVCPQCVSAVKNWPTCTPAAAIAPRPRHRSHGGLTVAVALVKCGNRYTMATGPRRPGT